MVTAKITRMVKDRGFGFATSSDGQQYFFHMTAIDPKFKLLFSELRDGMTVEFESEEAELGPRASPRSLRLVPIMLDSSAS